MAKETLVYLFTGFMDAGKTTTIEEIIYGRDFYASYRRILVIVCEDGDVEYDEKKLKTINASLARIENREDFTKEKLNALSNKFKPDAVVIEYNGTWEASVFYDTELPRNWVLAQALALVDATSFELYQNNMRAIMNEQLFKADTVIFNRCDDDTPKAKFRAAIKAINRPATIVYERADGKIDDSQEELPFDISTDPIEISDADYGLWFMDAMDNPEKYEGKRVHFLALCYNPLDGKLEDDEFVPGRFAMTCCAADMQFLGIKCKYKDAFMIGHKSWIHITATFKLEYVREYKGIGPVLYADEIKDAEKPEDEMVYFS